MKSGVRHSIEQVKEYVLKNSNSKLLSTEYINNQTEMEFLCGCGNIYHKTFLRFKTAKYKVCSKCYEKIINKIKLKKRYNSIKTFIENNSNCKILEINLQKCKKSNLKLVCECGNSFETSYDSFKSKNKRYCNECGIKNRAKKRRRSYETVKTIIADSDCKLLSVSYKNSKEDLKIQCNCGNIFYTSLERFTNKKYPKQQCNKCGLDARADKRKTPYSVILNFAKDNNLKLLTKESEYIDGGHTIEFLCHCGNVFKTGYNFFKNTKLKSCDNCVNNYMSDKMSKSHDEFEVEFYKDNDEFELISKYSGAHNKIKIKHKKCGHIYDIYASNFLRDGSSCPNCERLSSMEKITKSWLDKNDVVYVFQKKFEDCRNINKLSFDFYLPNYEILLELDGGQHYKVVEHFGGLKSYLKLKKNDLIKNKFCREHKNLKLIRIGFWEKYQINKILKYLLNI